MIKYTLAILLAATALAGICSAQDLGHKAPAQAKPVIIINATIHPVSGPVIPSGVITFEKGLIGIVAADTEPAAAIKVKDDAWTVIDAKGKHVYPGLIASYSQLGLTEIAAVRSTLDFAETGQATPEVRAGTAVNPDSTLIPVARTNGVLIAGVFPSTSVSGQLAYFDGPGGLVPGRPSVMQLDGWTSEQMAIDMQAGLVVNWPSMRPVTARWMNRSRGEQRKESEQAVTVIEKLFNDAKAYRDARATDQSLPADLRFEAMLPVLAPANGQKASQTAQKPVFILANDYDQIQAAVSFIDRHHLNGVIVGGMDAPLAAGDLKRHGIPVLVSNMYRFPKRADGDFDEPFSLPAKLKAAGVRFCLTSGEEAANERNLPYAAGMAVAYGLDRDEAVRAITLSAAEILGIATRYGSLQPGKSATLCITDGDILDITTQVERAWIDGRLIDLNNKQLELERKYREKYRQLDEHGG